MSQEDFLNVVKDQFGDEAQREIEKLLKSGLTMKVMILYLHFLFLLSLFLSLSKIEKLLKSGLTM